MFKSRLKIGILLVGITFCMGLFQTETPAEVNTENAETTKLEIPVSDGGFTIVLSKPIGDKAEVMKAYKDRKGEIKKEPVKDFTVSLPQNALVLFMVTELNTSSYDVKITVEEESSQTVVAPEATAGTVKDAQERSLKNPIKYICVFLPKNANAEVEIPPSRVVTVTPTVSLRGIKATVGPFVTPLSDHHYVKINDTIALGNRDQWGKSLGFLAHVPIWDHNFERFRWAFALSSGLAIGKISTSDGALTIGSSPVTFGGSFLLAGPTTDSLFAITGGGILKPVERLNGYAIGSKYPSDPKDLKKSVNRWCFFVALTFSYDIFKELGLRTANPTGK